jgi:DNA invertase Pin-like site-specific DNA recombinase/predicted DNA-binding protein (UPF0251 family)
MISTKIKSTHVARNAFVYVRQSTGYQVQHHLESQQRQYELSNVAIKLGWPKAQVVVIDDDLGKSASAAEGRTGFQRLVSEVALGHAGIVLGLEVSRLARNNRDWYELLDLCSMRATLIADVDGIYDPSEFNDRLLLGLKGTMSEAELHVLKCRMAAGLRHKAEKGELRYRLSAGYEFDDDGRIVKTSDEKVRQFVDTVFAKTFEIGSISGVTKFLAHERLRFPRRTAVDGSIHWVMPYYRGVYLMLLNPIYAGAYAYGRSEAVIEMNSEGRATVRRRAKPMAKWDVLIQDHHPAYISWDEFTRLGQIVEKNRPAQRNEASRVLREGAALLQGLARCGKCGRSMSVRYHGSATGHNLYYTCFASRAQMRSITCCSVGGRRIDDAVSRLFLDAISGTGAEIHLAALRKLDDREDAVLRQIELQLESARYEAGRAERQYNAVEPENRVVARTLESRWNAALQRVDEIQQQLDERKRQVAKRLSDDEERLLVELAHDLPTTWKHELVSDRDRKALLRAAIDEVQIRKETNRARLKVIWKGGAVDELSVDMPRAPAPPGTAPDLVELVRTLATRYDDAQIARVLARRRIKTPKKQLAFTANHVGDLRRKYGIPRCPDRAAEERAERYTVEQAAKLLGVSGTTIYTWLELGILHGQQIAESAPWSIEITEAERARLVADVPPGWLSLRDAAIELGVSRQTILNWVKAGKVEFVYVTRGRRRGLRIDAKTAPYRAQQNLMD